MNRITQLALLVLFPFLPFWAWSVAMVRDTGIDVFVTLLFIPFAFYTLIKPNINFPKYLAFFLIFTIYDLCSIYIFDLVPSYTNMLKYTFSNRNVMAFIVFFVIENTSFDEKFIKTMNRNIFIIVIISLLVSIVQLKNPEFFVAPFIFNNIDNETYLTESRIFSIYSWVDLNTLGITFPILLSILLNFYHNVRGSSPVIILTGIIVSFLTKARYVMISTLIVFSQLFFISKITFGRKASIIVIFVASILISMGVAKALGYNIQQVIDERILEKETNMGSASARVLSFYVFLKVFPEHPLMGVGPQTRSEVVRLLGGRAPLIHVGYLSYLYYYGLVGCFFFFMAIFFLIRHAWIVGVKNEFWAGFYGLLAFCFANMTMVYFNMGEMGIILIVIYLRYFTENPELKTTPAIESV
jgi:hypothetical protein